MRTTVTLPNDLVEQARQASGKERVSEALTCALRDYFALRQRLAMLDELFAERVPHNVKRIKAARRSRKWSS